MTSFKEASPTRFTVKSQWKCGFKLSAWQPSKVFPPFSLCLSLLPSCSFISSLWHPWKSIINQQSQNYFPISLSLALNGRCLFAPFSFLINKLSHDEWVYSVEAHGHLSLFLFLFLTLPLTVQAATIESEDFVVHLPSKWCELRRREAPFPSPLPKRTNQAIVVAQSVPLSCQARGAGPQMNALQACASLYLTMWECSPPTLHNYTLRLNFFTNFYAMWWEK